MNLIERVKNMLTTPKTEWLVVASETPDSTKIVTGYVLPLAIAGAIAAFIGYGLIGYNVLGVRFSGMNWGLHYALVMLVQIIVSIYVTALVVDALAPSFASEKNMGRSVQLVAYGSTPSLVAGLFNILPLLAGIVGLVAAVYGVYLFYLGLTPIKKTPEDKRVAYLVVCIIVLIVVYIILGLILARILYPVFGVGYPGL
ncbi:MAG TPA: Yip1 family protein [Chitinophagaceae bacterium]